MRSVQFILLLSIVAVCDLESQTQNILPDSLVQRQQDRLYTMPEIVVSANRWQVNVQQLPSSATVLTSADLHASNGNSLEAALQGIPGLFVKSYGGPGAVSTSSMRGMGAEHTLVLVDGQRYNNLGDGQVDFGSFLLQNIDRIEVLRGGYSSVYGADAVGGIINIITRRPPGKSGAQAELGAGSYGMNGLHIGANFNFVGIAMQLAARRERGKGNYEFDFNDGLTSGTLRRQNSDYALNQVQLLADVPCAPNLLVRVTSAYDESDRGSPGAVLAAGGGSLARLNDNGFLTQANLEWSIDPVLQLRFSSMVHFQRREYFDPLAAGLEGAGESVYDNRTLGFTPHLRYLVNSTMSVNLGAEYSHSSITSTDVTASQRDQWSVFASSDHVIDFPRSFFYQINVYPSIRYDYFTDVAGALNPKIGVNIGLVRPAGIRLKASYGKSFRAPTFDDLSWKGGGNPDLKPERSLSFDGGLSCSISFLGTLEFEANYFDIRTRDRIVWTPDRSGLWTPKNLQDVRSDGIELAAAWRSADDRFVVRASYANSDTRNTRTSTADDQTIDKQLPYLPHETAGVFCSGTIGRITTTVHYNFTGFRYSTESNEPNYILTGYGKTDANCSVRLTDQPFGASIRFEVSNIFNSSYELFPNYPMPLRTFALKLLVNY